jgi:uncharacterized membrane protein
VHKVVPNSLQLPVHGYSVAARADGAVYACAFTCCTVLLQTTPSDAVLVTAAAFLANVFESYLGAVIQGKVEWLNNDLVNVIQISVAAALAVLAKYYL